jgi:ABC-type nitrate/sulfonate/bicarbonate transport system permease component
MGSIICEWLGRKKAWPVYEYGAEIIRPDRVFAAIIIIMILKLMLNRIIELHERTLCA